MYCIHITIPDFSPSSFLALCWCLRMWASCLPPVSSIEAWGCTCKRGKSCRVGKNQCNVILPAQSFSTSTWGLCLHWAKIRRCRATEWSSHFLWAILWSLHSVTGLEEVKEAFRGNAWIWISSQRHYLPQKHTEGPAWVKGGKEKKLNVGRQ